MAYADFFFIEYSIEPLHNNLAKALLGTDRKHENPRERRRLENITNPELHTIIPDSTNG
jgi:hypothetical protein